MSLNESIIEDAALEWFGELGYAVGHGPQLASGEPAAARDSFGDPGLLGRLREAIRRLNRDIPSRTLATLGDPDASGLPKLLSGELGPPAAMLAAQAGVAGGNSPESPDSSNQRRQES